MGCVQSRQSNLTTEPAPIVNGHAIATTKTEPINIKAPDTQSKLAGDDGGELDPGSLGSGVFGEHPALSKEHHYHSFNKPVRSAMRTSHGSRRSTAESDSGGKVRFILDPNQPPEESRRTSFVHADSVSLKKIIDTFYEKVVADPALAEFFVGIDMDKLKRHQVKFMGLAFGGKELVFDEDPTLDLRKIHIRLIKEKGLNQDHFDKFYGHFKETLDQLPEIPDETKQSALTGVRGARDYFKPL